MNRALRRLITVLAVLMIPADSGRGGTTRRS